VSFRSIVATSRQCSAGRAPAMGGGDLDKARGAARGTHDAHALE
jgi:hypothetical protein